VNARALVRGVVPPLVFGVAFLLLWQVVVRAFDVKPYLFVAPSDIGRAFLDNWHLVRRAMIVTGTNALVGMVAGTVIGVLMSFLLLRFKLLDELLTPLAIAVNAIPIFVLVSVFNNMFSTTSEIPRRLMVTLVVYFVVLINVARGLRQVNATHMELMHSYAASPWAIMRKVRIPNAVPYLFTAIKIAAPLAVITAYVAEYFGGPQEGLGARITSNMATAKKANGWAYVAGACLLGLLFYVFSIIMESVTARGGATDRRGVSPGGRK
jgi:NitT/TauT family transport system permease protein